MMCAVATFRHEEEYFSLAAHDRKTADALANALTRQNAVLGEEKKETRKASSWITGWPNCRFNLTVNMRAA